MIELIIYNYLKNVLSVEVFVERPENELKEYVLLQKTGSSKENYICSATFALQSYAESLLRAAEINEEVKKAMDNLIILDEISKSALNSDYNYTDTAKKKYRYQAVYDVFF